MFVLLVSILGALLYANFVEWCIHKFILHDFARTKWGKRLVGFHWFRHHRKARLNQFFDTDYNRPVLNWNARTKEILALVLLGVVHAPLVLWQPIVYGTLILHLGAYYVLHMKAHRDPAWAKQYLPWHYAHHMGKNQNLNFNVTYPLTDWFLGTRVVH